MKKFALLLSTVLIFGSFLGACSGKGIPTILPTVAREHYDTALAYYDQIKIGMTYDEVGTLIGIPGIRAGSEPTQAVQMQATPEVPAPPGYTWSFGQDQYAIYYWFSENVNAGPTGTKLFSWDVSNIAYRKDAVTTEKKYESVTIGMAYAEVANILSAPGRLAMAAEYVSLDQPEITTKQENLKTYYWWADGSDPTAKTMILGFVDDKLMTKSQ
jgi:hypothetical protein